MIQQKEQVLAVGNSNTDLSLKELSRRYVEQVKTVKLDECFGVRTLAEVEKDYILSVLKKCEGNKNKASQLLGIGRKTLYNKLKQYRFETSLIEKKTE